MRGVLSLRNHLSVWTSPATAAEGWERRRRGLSRPSGGEIPAMVPSSDGRCATDDFETRLEDTTAFVPQRWRALFGTKPPRLELAQRAAMRRIIGLFYDRPQELQLPEGS